MAAVKEELTDPARNDFIPGSPEPFNADLLWSAGYPSRFPFKAEVIADDLERADAPAGGANLSGELRLERLGQRVPGLAVFKDGELVNDLRTVDAADLKLIREYLDHGRGGNDFIPR